MLASAGFPALIVLAQIYTLPESPRWYMSKGRVADAYKSMLRLRGQELTAARDIFYMHVLLQEEAAVAVKGNRYLELFTVPRIRRAALGAFIVMFGQQLCGVNVIAYYSSTIFVQGGFSEISALLASWGFGMVNWLFAIPAFFTIDTFGRRTLLIFCFPFMAAFLLLTGFAFWIPESSKAHIGLIALGIYLYAAFYSSSMGPVPFSYSAEVFPLSHRELGMSFATAVTWFFNFLVSITFPSLLDSFKPQGAFGWYAAWNIILWLAVIFFMPESKSLTLEELDMVFSVPTKKHALYQARQIPWWLSNYIFRHKTPKEPLYHFEMLENRNTYVDKSEVRHFEKREQV